MNTFERTRLMPQLYRDVYTSTLYLPEADALPAHLVAEVLNFHSTDIVALEEKINAAQTDYPPEQERALKLLMRAIILANGALNNPAPFEAEKAQTVTQLVVEALQLSQNKNFLIAAVQILFRINEVNSAVFLISNNLSELENAQVALKNFTAYLPDGRGLQPGLRGDSAAYLQLRFDRRRSADAGDGDLRHL
ncbi:Uncharacterised protein [Cedecea neteri]|uniref:Uncharacterized protein n=1 Tax=Cedecea neteri TaxID=158822 RepID=A0A2X3J4R9_9ENTR|nr:Uncharacterised protein [Cedecea neteri]